jgi:hypothetical protein
MRRVVITGTGVVSPLGCGTEITWSRLIGGQNGASRVTAFDVSDIPAQIACSVPTDPSVEGAFNPDDWMEPKEQRKVDKFILFGVAAADMALKDAGWNPQAREDQIATGVMIGSGVGGLEGIVEAGYTLRDKGPRRVSPVLHSRTSHQPDLRPGLDPPRPARAEPRRGHRLFHRRACHWRRGPVDRARRCRGDGCRRRRSRHLPDRACGICRLQGALHRLQRHAGKGVATL